MIAGHRTKMDVLGFSIDRGSWDHDRFILENQTTKRSSTKKTSSKSRKNAIRAEAERMDSKRQKLESVLMAYGELEEYPDFDSLQKRRMGPQSKNQKKTNLSLTCSLPKPMRCWPDFSQGIYWEDKKFQARPLLLDLYTYIEKNLQSLSAGIRTPASRNKSRIDFLKPSTARPLQVILLLEELPLIDVKELNLKKVSDRVRKASQMYRKYEELSPYLEPVRYLWQGSKLLLASNPLIAAGWIAGSELFLEGREEIR